MPPHCSRTGRLWAGGIKRLVGWLLPLRHDEKTLMGTSKSIYSLPLKLMAFVENSLQKSEFCSS